MITGSEGGVGFLDRANAMKDLPSTPAIDSEVSEEADAPSPLNSSVGVLSYHMGSSTAWRLTMLHARASKTQVLMLENNILALVYISTLKDIWGIVRAVGIQKKYTKTILKQDWQTIEEIFTTTKMLDAVVRFIEEKDFKKQMAAYMELANFYDLVKLASQRIGFGMPVRREVITELERTKAISR